MSHVIKKIAICIVSGVCFLQPIVTSHVAQAKGVTTQVPRTYTPVSEVQMLHSLRISYISLYNKEPTKNILAMGWAQTALETGHGKMMSNKNFGNTGPRKQDVDYKYFITRGGGKYVAFDTFEEGAAVYWTVAKRCFYAWEAFKIGEPEQAARALKRCNYYNPNVEEAYVKNMHHLYWHAIKTVIPRYENEQQATKSAN
jgi:hypothetical protein